VTLTACEDDEQRLESLKAGAIKYMLKSAKSAELIQAIRYARRGEPDPAFD